MCSTTPKLYYFDIKGRAEVTRQMFNLASVKFEDIRYSFEEWGQLKSSGNTGYFKFFMVCVKYLQSLNNNVSDAKLFIYVLYCNMSTFYYTIMILIMINNSMSMHYKRIQIYIRLLTIG